MPIPGDEHKRREHQWVFFFRGENTHGEDGCEELAGETVDRGGTLSSDGLLEFGFDFFAFGEEVRHLGFEEAESLSEVGDGEVRGRVWVCRICVARDNGR